MIDGREVILICDPLEDRFNWFKVLLKDKYAQESIHVHTLEEARRLLENSSDLIVTLVFLSDDLPLSKEIPKSDPNFNFDILQSNNALAVVDADYVCIVTRAEDPDLHVIKKHPCHVHLRSFPPTEDDRRRVIIELGALGNRLQSLTEISKVAEITQWDMQNRTLQRQIRSLSENHDLTEGAEHLYSLIRNCLDCDEVKKIEIKELGQGKSGASVFRFKVLDANNNSQDYVLKVSQALWKLEIEVEGHLTAIATHTDSYTKHFATLGKPLSCIKFTQPKIEHKYIVASGQWYAIHYDFLGGSGFGEFIDLKAALTGLPIDLVEKTKNARSGRVLNSVDGREVGEYRRGFLEATLDGLCDLWYAKNSLADRIEQAVWKIEDAPAKEFVPLPPYQLTRRVKGWIQDFLESPEAAFGSRLFPDWNRHVELLLRLVGDDSIAEFKLLCSEIPFTLSPVHGDLNASNVLLWLKYDNYPFVIDLPFYQEFGHVLQDFARLETEIKFSLMDRQEDSPISELPAFDNSPSQVKLWSEMERDLTQDAALSGPDLKKLYAGERHWLADGFKDNVNLCYKLVILLRVKAYEIQRTILKGKPAPALFADEYLPALLYHTARSVGYPTLSVFKRLLAVHSSGLILERLL